jgi:large subunit ribosomal protein L18
MLTKKEQRLRRARQTRIRIATQGVARLTVNRTNLHIYASVISGDGAQVLASASTAEAEVRKSLGASGKGCLRSLRFCLPRSHQGAGRSRA